MTTLSPAARLYGMMEHLLLTYAAGITPTPVAPRDVVAEQDALDAVIELATFLDAHTRSGAIPQDRARHMASMLMIIRDYIKPLPIGPSKGPSGETVDGVTNDLQLMTELLRTKRMESGLSG